MSAVLAMPRRQVDARDAGVSAATKEKEGALTVEACAMLRSVLDVLRQIDALALKAMRAEASHNRAVLLQDLQLLRACAARTVERVYRHAGYGGAPASIFEHVRAAQDDLLREAEAMLFAPVVKL